MARRLMTARGNILLLLCVMYFLTYLDRVNVSTASGAFQKDLGLNNVQVGLVFSLFAYPYLVFQVVGGWFADRFGPRWTLAICGVVWAVATILTGLATGLFSMVVARLLLGLGEGATFPVATRAISDWLPGGKSGFAQGITHASARLGNAVTPPLIVALMAATSWRGSFIIVGIVSLAWAIVWVWYYRDDPRQHPGVTSEDLVGLPARRDRTVKRAPIPWLHLSWRMLPVTFTYFCYGWTLWTFLSWVPQFMLHSYKLDLKHSAVFASVVFFGGVVGDALGGILSDRILRKTGSLVRARRDVVVAGLSMSLVSSIPILFVHDATLAALTLGAAFFFAELTIGAMWATPMDIAPHLSGTASGLMNCGSALAAILSPIVFGWIIDTTGSWPLPFIGTMVLMGAGAIGAFFMHPERPFVLSLPTTPSGPPETFTAAPHA
jgi:MFS family permease